MTETFTVPAVPTIAALVPVTEVMTRSIVSARRDLRISALVELMLRHRIGCVPIVDEPGRPVGMVTKLDLVEQLLGPASEAPPPMTAGDLMMPLAITLGERASVAHVAALMAAEDVHHIPICNGDGCLVGLVSSIDIARWLARNDGLGGF